MGEAPAPDNSPAVSADRSSLFPGPHRCPAAGRPPRCLWSTKSCLPSTKNWTGWVCSRVRPRRFRPPWS